MQKQNNKRVLVRFFMRFSWEFATKKQDLRWVRRAMRRGAVAGIYFGALTGADALHIFGCALTGIIAASVYILMRLHVEFLLQMMRAIKAQ